jgi:hypothetical protein
MTPTMTDEETFVTAKDCDFADSDFAAIEAAVMETSRGRWFLQEFARRNRHANTDAVLAAINRLQDDTLPGRAVRVMDHLHDNLASIAAAFEKTRSEVALLPPADRVGLQPLHPDVPLSDEDAAGIKRIVGILKNLRSLEARLQAMIAICDPAPSVDDPVPASEPIRAHPSFLM